MAHHYSNSLYDRLADRLNQFPQGAPLSDSLFAILKILFSEKEAGLVAQLPIKPFTVDRAAAIWKLDKATAQNMLEDLAGRAMLLDMEQNGQQMFCLPPPMAGFFEFSMMRVRGDVNQKALAELYYSISTSKRFRQGAVRRERDAAWPHLRTGSRAPAGRQARGPRLRARFTHHQDGPRTSASACATAAIKCSISGGRVMPQWTSA